MLGDAMYATNGIFNQIFAQTGHFDTLCIGSTCLTESQLDALLAKNGIQASNATSTDATTTPTVQIGDPTTTISGASSSTPPTITINGDNPATIQVGDSYDDLGATVSDTGPGQAGDTNLGVKTFLNGTLVSNIVIDTSSVATDTIDYVATDTDGLTATSTRTVIIDTVASTVTASSTDATSTAQ